MTKMNVGNAVADLALAVQIGAINQKLGPQVAFLAGYSPKGLGAKVNLNSRLGSDAAGSGRGSEISPYLTWKGVVDAMGPPTTLAGYEAPREIVVDGGTYDVSTAVLPMGQWIITLNRGATLTGKLTMALNSTQAFASLLPPSLTILGDEGAPADAQVPLIDFVQSTSGVAVATVAVAMRYVTHGNITSPATVTTLAVDLDRTQPDGAFANVEAVIVANRVNWPSTLSCASIDALFGFQNDDITVTATSRFRGTEFVGVANTFTGPAASLEVDATANFYFKAPAAWVLAGGATKVIIADVTP